MNKKVLFFSGMALVLPFISMAADVNSGLATLGGGLSTLGQLIIAATVVAFFGGVFQFVFNPEKKDEAKDIMMGGIIGLFVMVSLWGIIGFLQKSTVGDDATVRNNLNQLVPEIKK